MTGGRHVLRATILDVLTRGPRKPAILRALAESRGFDRAKFHGLVRELKDGGLIVTVYRYGGPHYALARASRAKLA